MDGKELVDAFVELIRKAETDLPEDVEAALEKACKRESSELARTQLQEILRNVKVAREKRIPLCQDTGTLNFYVRLGMEADFSQQEISHAIVEATKLATGKIPLRPNAVHPLTRANSKNNTGRMLPHIEFECVEGEKLEVTCFPKGAGSENMSRLGMLNPTSSLSEVKKFILQTVADAGGRPCPPTVIGVGIGGSSDLALKLAKSALLRRLDEKNPDARLASLEEDLEKEINALGVGPMGLGGDATCLSVSIETAHCHTGSLPVAVNMGCWATRRASMKV